MRLNSIIATYSNPNVAPIVPILDVRLVKQNPSSISDGWMLNPDGTWLSRFYPGYTYSVPVGTGRWLKVGELASNYQIRYTLIVGTATTFYGYPGSYYNFSGAWRAGNELGAHEIYGHIVHSPPLTWSGEKIMIEVRRVSDALVMATANVTFASS